MTAPDARVWLTIVGALAACAALYACWARLRSLGAGRRWLLLALRASLLALAVLAIADPMLTRRTRAERPAEVIVAVDTSQSMTGITEADGRTRLGAASDALSSGPLASALHQARVELYAVDEHAYRVTDPADRATGAGTDLRVALSELLRLPRARTPAACLLISDGADGSWRPPARVAEALGGYGVPVYCLGVGSAEPVPDVSIPGLVAPRSVTEGHAFDVRVLARAAGMQDRPIELAVRADDREVARQELAAGSAERRASIRLTAGRPGYQRYVVAATPLPDEVTSANNRRSFVVRVEPAQARLLLIEGRPRREYAFLRRLLLRMEDLETVILLRKRDPAEFWLDAEQPRRADLTAAGELRRYRAVVLSNVETGALGSLPTRLAEYVLQGGALAMLGGGAAFGAGGYAGTPLARVLPVRLGNAATMLGDPVSVRPTAEGELARALLDTGVQSWGRLPLLEGINAVAGAAPGAEVAMQAVSGSSVLGPAVVAGRHGAGRTLAVTLHDTWRWRQSPNADEHSRAAWEAMWATLIGWLITPRSERRVVVELGRDSFEAGETVRAEVHVRDSDMQPLAGARVQVALEGGEAPQTLAAEPAATPGLYRAAARLERPGSYVARATAHVGSERVGSDQRRFDVTEPTRELTDAARPEVLCAIAEETGGAYLPIQRAEEMARRLPLAPALEERPLRLRPTRTVAFFLVLLAIAAADWLLRRRWGLG